MSVLYLLTAPRPLIAGTDAVFNEVAALQAEFGGEAMNLFPFRTPRIRLPRLLYGMQAAPGLRRAEARHDTNHIYFGVLYWFPVLDLLRKPIVYTVSATLDARRKPRALAKLKGLHRIVVSNERDTATLDAWGLSNYALIPPGIDTAAISRHPLPLEDEVTLLMASAPWHRRHFDLKGIDVLLETAAKMPALRLVMLWRGILIDELRQRISRHGVQDRVEVVNAHTDIDAHLAHAHAGVLLAKESAIIKAYPHSLVESLVAGKPVIVSNTIPMSDYVTRNGCGLVLDQVTVPAVMAAVEALKRNYGELARRTVALPGDDFSIRALIDRHRPLYASA
jgi:glycosyltransferase involved in cell wall biosynthesis